MISASELADAEQALWSDAKKFATVLEEGINRLECGVVVLDFEGRISWLNSPAADLLAGDKAKLIGTLYADALGDALGKSISEPEDFLGTLREALVKGQSLEGVRLRLGDSKEAESLDYWSTPVEDGPPSVQRVEHFYTASGAPLAAGRRQAPSGAKEDALGAIAAIVPEMIFTIDAEGRITWCNPAAARLTGLRERKLNGMILTDIAAPQDQDRLRGLLDRSIKQGEPVKNEQLVMSRPGGTSYWAELTLLPIHSTGSAKADGAQGVLRDVTDRKMAEAIRDILEGNIPG
jgi:PAS domain S-box-containing protein